MIRTNAEAHIITFYTDMDWGDVHNYHIAPNRGLIDIDICVNIISELY